MRKWIIPAVVIVALALVGGYFGYHRYVDSNIIDSSFPAVKNTSLRVANELQLFTAPSNATYKELFEKVDADLAEVDKKQLEIQTAATPSTAKWMSATGAYLTASQNVLRAEGIVFRKKLAAESAFEIARQAERRYEQATSSYEQLAYTNSRDETMTEARKLFNEFESAVSDFNAALVRLSQARETLTSFVPTDALIDPALIEEARKRAK